MVTEDISKNFKFLVSYPYSLLPEKMTLRLRDKASLQLGQAQPYPHSLCVSFLRIMNLNLSLHSNILLENHEFQFVPLHPVFKQFSNYTNYLFDIDQLWYFDTGLENSILTRLVRHVLFQD